MGKRKRSRKGNALTVGHQNRNPWPEIVLEELLAFLDYGVHKELTPSTINEEAAQHLTEECKNGEYSSDQVRSKFRWFWSQFGPDDAVLGNSEAIYKEGSKSLSWPEDGQRERIAQRTRAIMHKKHTQYLTSPMKTRSGSEVFERNTASPSRFRSASASSTITFRGRRTAQTTRFHLRSRQNPDAGRPADGNTRSLLDQGTPIKTEPTLTIFETPRHPRSSCSESPEFQSAETSQSPSPKVLTTPPALVVSAPGSASVGVTTELESSLESMTRRAQQDKVKLQQLENRRAWDIDFWRARCRAAETERAELKKMNTALTVRLGDFIGEDQKLDAKDVARYEARILRLEDEINGFRRSERLAISDAPDLPNDTILDITKSMKRIAGRLRRSFEGQDSHPCESMLAVPEDSQLESLLEKVLNVDVAGSSIRNVQESLTGRISRPTLLRSLSAAALAAWVLHSAGEDILFDRYSGDSTRGLTSRYARAIKYVASRDPNFARSMGFAIHRDIITEPSFKAYLDKKATDLAERLQHELAPLCSQSEESESDLNDWSVTETPAIEGLTEAFREALEIYCQLAITGHSYACIWYAPGAWYDPIRMTAEPAMSDQDSKTAVVEVTLLPGISEVRRDYSGAGNGTFVDGGNMGQEAVECLIPAVVSISVVATAETRPARGSESPVCGGEDGL